MQECCISFFVKTFPQFVLFHYSVLLWFYLWSLSFFSLGSSGFEDASQDRQRSTGGLSTLSFRRSEYGSSPPTRGDISSFSRGSHGKWDSRSSGRSDRDSDSQSELDSGVYTWSARMLLFYFSKEESPQPNLQITTMFINMGFFFVSMSFLWVLTIEVEVSIKSSVTLIYLIAMLIYRLWKTFWEPVT